MPKKLVQLPSTRCILAAGTVLAGITGAAGDITEDSFELKTVTFDSTGVDAGLLGQNLQIRLYITAGGEVDFDNVILTPEPATMTLLALGGLGLIRRRRRA